MQTEIATGLGLLAGVLVLGGVGLAFAHNAKGAGSPTPELPAAGVIAPGVQSVQIPAGSSFGLALPAGATWGQGALIAGGTVVQLTYTNNEALVTVPPAIATVGIQWKDAAGRQQFTLILILPPGVSAQSPVTDTPAQTNAQALLVDVAKQNVPGLSYPAATGMDARFAAALLAFQTFWNQRVAPNFATPIVLPTTGVLDFLTYAALSATPYL